MMMSTKLPDPTDKYVGSRVRMRRIMLGMSQGALGDALGLTFQQVQKYEKGTNRVSASRLQQLSQILQVPVPFFFEGAPHSGRSSRKERESPTPIYITQFLSSTDGHALLKAFSRIKSSAVRRSIVRMIETIAEFGRS
jgi:transcriptional regulator with XRE-family HTH domain